jgi:hypothetical protein
MCTFIFIVIVILFVWGVVEERKRYTPLVPPRNSKTVYHRHDHYHHRKK